MTTTHAIPNLRGHTVSISDMLDAGQLIAKRIGHSPRAAEYKAARELFQCEAAERGELQLLPSYASIHRVYPNWDEFLVAAGLPPLGGRRTGGGRSQGRKEVYTAQMCSNAINTARSELGDPISATAYGEWRANKIEDDPTLAYTLPSLGSIYRRFPSWNTAVLTAIEAERNGRAA